MFDIYLNLSAFAVYNNFKWKKKRRKAWSSLFKHKKIYKKIKLKVLKYFNLRWVSKKQRKRYKKYIPKIESTKEWLIRKQYWLDKWLKVRLQHKTYKLFFALFFKKRKKFRFFKKLTNYKLRQWSFKSRKSLYDEAFQNHYRNYNKNYKLKNFNNLNRFNILTLFLIT